jgi:ABC-type uncharacterized transport system permease subunit
MLFKTFIIVLQQAFLLLPLMIGGYYSIVLMRLPDLALEAAFLMGAVGGSLISTTCSPLIPPSITLLLVILSSSICGIGVGYITSLFREKLEISHLFASIISIGLFHGIARALLQSTHYSLLHLRSVFSFAIFDHYSELIMLFLLSTSIFFFHRFLLSTEFGLAMEMYGINKFFFTHHKISLPYVGYLGTMIAHGLAGISGFCVAQSHFFVDILMGTGIGLQVITALLFGIICAERLAISRLYKPFTGIICYFTLQAIIILSGLDLTYFNSIQALIVAACCLYRKEYLKHNRALTRYEIGV